MTKGVVRHPASEAVIELRRALKMTQQQFAVSQNAAVTTVARWETSRPPSGESLVALAVIADEAGLAAITDTLMRIYIESLPAFVRAWLNRLTGPGRGAE